MMCYVRYILNEYTLNNQNNRKETLYRIHRIILSHPQFTLAPTYSQYSDYRSRYSLKEILYLKILVARI